MDQNQIINEIHAFTGRIRALIAKDDLKEALRQLRLLLDNSPALDEVLHQSARLQHIRKQIRMGKMDDEQASLAHSRINSGIVELLRELESPEEIQPAFRAEVERAAGVVNSKNVVVDSTLTAGRDLNIGDKHFHYYGERKIPRALTTPPFIPPVFLGRDEELREVHDKLFGGQNLLLLVNGQGGIGKTSFAAKYWELYQDEYWHLAFIYVGSGIAEALLSMAPALGQEFPETMTTLQRLEQLIFFVANLQKPCLMVLDNANDAEDLEKTYPMLGRCTNFHLLITSRLAEFEETASYSIGALKEHFPLDLFKKYYPRHQEAENELFWGIFHAVDGNTLVVEILAKNLREINRDETFYPVSQLLTDLQKKGLLQLSEQAKVKVHWQGFEKTEPEQIIQALYDLHPLEADELALLSNLAVLPPENIPYTILKSLLQPENARQFSDTLTRLYRKGWIEKSETDGATYYKISPVVQEIVRRKNSGLRGDCQILLDTLIKKLDFQPGVGHFINATYDEALYFARFAEAIESSFEAQDNDLAKLCHYIGNYYITTGNINKAFFFFEKDVNTTKELLTNNPDKIELKSKLAIAYNYLGNTYTSLGHLEEALKFYLLYNQQQEEICIALPNDEGYKNNLAISYEKLGSTQSSLGNLEQALTYFESFTNLMKELYEAYPQNVSFKNNLAISYSKLGSTQSSLGNLEQALTFFESFTNLMKELYEAYPQNVSFKNGLAISYSKLGEIQIALGNLEQALTFFEERSRLGKELYEAYPQNVSFKNGLAISYSKLGETQSALGNLEQALTYFESFRNLMKELYEAYPQNVSFKNGLVVSYSKLGVFYRDQKEDKPKARPYFEQCYTLWKELSEAYPTYAEFQKNFKWAEGALERLGGSG